MVSEVSAFVFKRGGNIITCHGVRFGRQLFAANLLISAPPDNFAAIEKDISEIAAHHPRLLRTRGLSTEERETVLLYELSVYSFDREGLVSKVAEVLADDGLDIVQLSSITYPAPFDGQQMFMIELVIESPNHLAAKRAAAMLDSLAAHEGWDLYWKPILKPGVRINPLATFPPSSMASEVEVEVPPRK